MSALYLSQKLNLTRAKFPSMDDLEILEQLNLTRNELFKDGLAAEDRSAYEEHFLSLVKEQSARNKQRQIDSGYDPLTEHLSASEIEVLKQLRNQDLSDDELKDEIAALREQVFSADYLQQKSPEFKETNSRLKVMQLHQAKRAVDLQAETIPEIDYKNRLKCPPPCRFMMDSPDESAASA